MDVRKSSRGAQAAAERSGVIRVGPQWAPGAEVVARYDADGFVVIRGLLTRPEVARFRTATLPFVEGARHRTRDLAGWEDVFLQEQVIWPRDAVLRGLSLHPRLAAVAAALTGTDVRIYLDQIIVKYPGDLATLPHQDAPFLPFNDRRSVNAWVALGRVTAAHGALYYYRGSNAVGLLRKVELGDPGDDLLVDVPQLADRELVLVPAEPGDVVFHDCLVVHAAGPNTSEEDRLAYSVQFMPEDARYNGRRNPLVTELGLRTGDRLASADLFPVLPRA